MAKYLSQEWLDRQRELAAEVCSGRPGLSGRVQRVVTDGPVGQVAHHFVLDDGVLQSSALGADDTAALTLTCPYEVAVAIDTGELDASVAYMQGRLKAAGDLPLLHTLLVATHGPAYAALAERLRAATET